MFIKHKVAELHIEVDREGKPVRRFIKKLHLSTSSGSFIITRRGPTDERWLRIHRQTKSRSHCSTATVQLIMEHIKNG